MKRIRITFLKRKFQKTYINVMSKVGFITSKAECEAASLAIKHVTFKVFTTSKAEREAASLAIKHLQIQGGVQASQRRQRNTCSMHIPRYHISNIQQSIVLPQRPAAEHRSNIPVILDKTIVYVRLARIAERHVEQICFIQYMLYHIHDTGD